MPIKTVELICLPCKKCDGLEARIREIIKGMEMGLRVKIPFEFKHTKTLQNIDMYSLNASQTPVILINGAVEFAGRIDITVLKRKLESLQRI